MVLGVRGLLLAGQNPRPSIGKGQGVVRIAAQGTGFQQNLGSVSSCLVADKWQEAVMRCDAYPMKSNCTSCRSSEMSHCTLAPG